jgi:hypothetical protein
MQAIRDRRLTNPKPLDNVKIYGGEGHGWTGGQLEATRRMWRNIIGGLASSRFHRPGPDDRPFGIGANELARAHLRNVRTVMEAARWPNLEPGLGFLRHKSDAVAAVQAEKTPIVYTRNARGTARLYIHGEESAAVETGGRVSVWDDTLRLALANEFTGDRSWRGTYHGVAIYNRALTVAEIAEHHAAGALQHRDGLQVRFSSRQPSRRNA